MLYSEEAVRANIRNRDGKRVFYLGKGDQLTSSARDFLSRSEKAFIDASSASRAAHRARFSPAMVKPSVKDGMK